MPDRPEPCETESAELCSTTTSYGLDNGGSTTTTATTETCLTIYGCHVTDWDSTTTTTGPTCQPTNVQRDIPVTNTIPAFPTSLADNRFVERADESSVREQDLEINWQGDADIIAQSCDWEFVIIYCSNPESCDTLARRLERLTTFPPALLTVKRVASRRINFTAYFYVEWLPKELAQLIKQMSEVRLALPLLLCFGSRY
jgi:hypothetical protein